ncbi:hypothetical protein D3C72_1736160 [compost metagenome]
MRYGPAKAGYRANCPMKFSLGKEFPCRSMDIDVYASRPCGHRCAGSLYPGVDGWPGLTSPLMRRSSSTVNW